MMTDAARAEEQRPLLAPDGQNDPTDRDGSTGGGEDGGESRIACKAISPDVTTLIVKRIRAMIMKLLPIEVDEDELKSPTSSIITSDVIVAFTECGGTHYADAVPYCLLTARYWFHREALRNPSDYDENEGRKLACEVLARRIVSRTTLNRQHVILSTRYTRFQRDGDETNPTSALELACDQQATVFLSSSESQRCIFALWNGYLVQDLDERGHVVYTVYRQAQKHGFLDHFDVSRLAVPRYNNMFRIILWVAFLVFYTVAVQTPDREFGVEDILLYVQVLGYSLELVTRAWKISSWSVLSFWWVVDVIIYTLLIIAFGFRVADLSTADPDRTALVRLRAFQLTSCAAPLIWAKLLTVFDTWQFFGVLQIVVSRMLRESAVFFALLVLLAIGFAQALVGLDVADNGAEMAEDVYHSLLQGLLGSPDFELFKSGTDGYPFSMILYYLWNIATVLILVNVLVALFSSAYEDVVDDAMNWYLTGFAEKTVIAVRAPDSFVYIAPLNLVEIVILPLEWITSADTYAAINRFVMRIVFFPALCAIAFVESRYESHHIRRFAADMDPEDDSDVFEEDPETPPGQDGKICEKSFDQLAGKFPDLTASVTSATLHEVKQLKKDIAELKKLLQAKQ